MTTSNVPTVTDLAVALLDAAHRQLLRAMDGLTDDQLHRQPSHDTNSIAWLAWHLSRWKDRYGAILTGGEQVWAAGGWAERFGKLPEDTGHSDTPEQVAAFRPEGGLLLGYVEAAHRSVTDRVASLLPEQWAESRAFSPTGEQRTVWQAFVSTVMDFSQHTGQVAYVRGLIEGKGWRD